LHLHFHLIYNTFANYWLETGWEAG
jgi:hypothetical protein